MPVKPLPAKKKGPAMTQKILAISAMLALAAATTAQANVVFTDSFELPATQNWKVYDLVGDDSTNPADGSNGWANTAGSGIEIQTNSTLNFIDAHHGNQYVELDSDSSNGGTSAQTNSAMTRTVDLAKGWYELVWYYFPRTNNAGDDNLIEVFVDGFSEDLATNLIGRASLRRDGSVTDWVKITNAFYVDGTDNLYGLTFRAGGTQNELGGFVDSVSLAAIPLPASVLLLGSALGAASLAGRRRWRLS
jgi:hypothetical protein